MTDASLNKRFRDGNDNAVREVYEQYGRVMYAVAWSVLRQRELAAECVQLAMVKAWKAAPSFDPDRELRPWLATIVRRVAVDLHRQQERRDKNEAVTEVEPVLPAANIEHTWEVWEVRSALDALPDDEREIVRLSHFEGLTHAEIAQTLAIPEGTVKSRSHRAHQHLARTLAYLVEVTS